jgi:ABC-type glycerol-3-phosphate transport system permease component
VVGGLLALVVLAPYLVMLFTALKPDAELRITPPRLLPIHWRPGTFLEVLADPGFRTWLRVSLVIATASTLIVIVTAAPAAYYTARHRFPGRSAFLMLVLVTQMFAPTALVVGLYREFFELGLVNTYTALILVNAAFNLAFAVLPCGCCARSSPPFPARSRRRPPSTGAAGSAPSCASSCRSRRPGWSPRPSLPSSRPGTSTSWR